jgi:hypothetical protein
VCRKRQVRKYVLKSVGYAKTKGKYYLKAGRKGQNFDAGRGMKKIAQLRLKFLYKMPIVILGINGLKNHQRKGDDLSAQMKSV